MARSSFDHVFISVVYCFQFEAGVAKVINLTDGVNFALADTVYNIRYFSLFVQFIP